MVPPIRTRPATKAEIAAAWQRLHDDPEPEEPKRIRTRKPPAPKPTEAQRAVAERLERIKARRKGAKKRDRARGRK